MFPQVTLALIGVSLYNLSFSYVKNGDFAEARECASKALRILQAKLPAGHGHIQRAESHVRHLELLSHGAHASSSQQFTQSHMMMLPFGAGSGRMMPGQGLVDPRNAPFMAPGQLAVRLPLFNPADGYFPSFGPGAPATSAPARTRTILPPCSIKLPQSS